MNNLFRRVVLLCSVLTAGLSHVNAQQAGVNITGVVTNAEDGLLVRQASVAIDKKGLGTATNAAGMFALMIPAANMADTLKISCVGFKTQKYAIANLKNGEVLHCALVKNNNQLSEVAITFYDTPKIIQKAISRIGINYINHPHILRGFYRMYVYNSQNPLQLSEAVFDVYNFGYADTHADIFKLIKARSEKNERDLNSLEFVQKPNTVFEEDVVNHLRACGFLNNDGLERHQFTTKGVVDINGYQVYDILFEEKPGIAERTFRGHMYIDVKSYAFVYFDFGLSPSVASDLASGTFTDRSIVKKGDVDLNLLFDRTKVSYQQVGNKWVLSGVDGDDSLSVKSAALNYVAHVKFNYQITAVDTVQKESFNAKIGRNDNINNYKSNSDSKFWNDYNILISDFDTDDIFKKLKVISKAGK